MRQETKQMLETCHEFGQTCLDTANDSMNVRPEMIDPLTTEEMESLTLKMTACRQMMQDCRGILGRTGT